MPTFPTAWQTGLPVRLQQQFDFLIAADRLKGVLRANRLADDSRRENSAEHSWHLTLFALTLAEWADDALDLGRVLRMLILHDVIEAECGDTPLHAAADADALAMREASAADVVFGLLPDDQCAEFRDVWNEFEAADTTEARFAKSLDRLQPVLLNHLVKGGTWTEYAVDAPTVRRRTAAIGRGSSTLATVAEQIFDEAVREGWLKGAEAGNC